MRLVKTQIQDYSRDCSTNAVINTNVAALNAYKQQRDNKKTISELKSEIEELKMLVRELTKSKNV